MQYRTTMVGGLEAPPVVANVWDSFFVHFHPVRDPNNLTDPPGTPPPPLILEPDKQSPNAGDLPLPPVAPNAGVTERGTLERNRVRGTTGYSRSWPLARALRVMTVTWGPLDKDDADAVFLFLQEEVAWRFVQPLGVDLAVMTASRPELLPDPAMRTFNITVDVGVLVWTGA
jgi:hypothetical protein